MIEKDSSRSAEIPVTGSLKSTVGRRALKGVGVTGALRGSIGREKSREEGLSARMSYLARVDSLRRRASGRIASWRELLSGEVSEVSGGGVHPNSKASLKKAGGEMDKSIPSLHTYVKTGVDYRKLRAEHPAERYKFYHSFANQEAAEAYLADVMAAAIEQGISMSTKSFDHAYDGINIYTYHHSQMQEIIKAAYQRHPEAWGATEHFLQAEIDGVNPSHIGWAQEPDSTTKGLSHSGRMGKIGAAIDAAGGLSEDAYLAGCTDAGVRPEAPWLLTPKYQRELHAVATDSHR